MFPHVSQICYVVGRGAMAHNLWFIMYLDGWCMVSDVLDTVGKTTKCRKYIDIFYWSFIVKNAKIKEWLIVHNS